MIKALYDNCYFLHQPIPHYDSCVKWLSLVQYRLEDIGNCSILGYSKVLNTGIT